eukprot:scaffold170191_cov54-Attheya_sp.AAC.6
MLLNEDRELIRGGGRLKKLGLEKHLALGGYFYVGIRYKNLQLQKDNIGVTKFTSSEVTTAWGPEDGLPELPPRDASPTLLSRGPFCELGGGVDVADFPGNFPTLDIMHSMGPNRVGLWEVSIVGWAGRLLVLISLWQPTC